MTGENMEDSEKQPRENITPTTQSKVETDTVLEKKQQGAAKKEKRRRFFEKIPAFCTGLVIGGAVVFVLMVSTIGFAAFFHPTGSSDEINIIELKKTIEASSDLTVTKVHYADFVLDKDSKSVPTPLGDAPLPFTENSVLVAYKGTVGLGFDISTINPVVDTDAKTITIDLPEIGILYDEFDNDNTKSFTLANDVFSKNEEFESSNELIGRLKAQEEASVLGDEGTLAEARTNAEDVIRNVISGWDVASGYQVIFE